VTEKFEFIDAEYAAYRESGDIHVPSVVKMCRWMEVSRSGFYEWRGKPESATAKRRGIIALVVQKSFDESDGTYGYRRVHADLAAWGVPAGPEFVRSVMRELGLESCQPRPWRFSLTEGDGQEHGIPDRVHRDFTAGAPGEKLVGDITYIPTAVPGDGHRLPHQGRHRLGDGRQLQDPAHRGGHRDGCPQLSFRCRGGLPLRPRQ
jgi:hypothetical protein